MENVILIFGSAGLSTLILGIIQLWQKWRSDKATGEVAADAQDLAEFRAIIAEQRGLIDTYRAERGRIERLEERVQFLEVRDEECQRALAEANQRIKELSR